MSSTVNNGILVDEAVQEQCRGRYVFKSLPPVKAKGYDKPVRILEPSDDTSGSAQKNKKNTVGFVGRAKEKWTILAIANNILDQVETNQNSIVFLTGESGMGKSALVSHVFEELKVKCKSENILATFAKSTSTETDQRIPLRCVK
jgi:putative ribosome biogenesis GTPase RsgA